MIPKIKNYICQIMICDADTDSEKEKNLIDILEGLLSEAENQKPLN